MKKLSLVAAAVAMVTALAEKAHAGLFDYMGKTGLVLNAVVNLKSTNITNATASPKVINPSSLQNGNTRFSQGLATIANGDSIGSTYRLFRIRSCDMLSSLQLYCTAITSAAADVGLYDKNDVNAGAVVDADFYASAQSIATAISVGTNIVFEAAAAGGLITNAEKRVWEALGLSADPGKEYDVVLTLTAAATAGGTVLLRGFACANE